MGNRVRTIENGVTTEYSVNNLNQYVQVGNAGHSFDADGNLAAETSSQGTNTFIFDAENRFTALNGGLGLSAFAFDALDSRVMHTDATGIQWSVYDPTELGNLVASYDSAGQLLTRFDYGHGLVLQQSVDSGVAYYSADDLGNVHHLTTTRWTRTIHPKELTPTNKLA